MTWYLLGPDPYERSTPEQRRLTEVMRVLGWRRKIIRHNAQRVGRGFRRGLDTRTIFVFRCPVTKEIYPARAFDQLVGEVPSGERKLAVPPPSKRPTL